MARSRNTVHPESQSDSRRDGLLRLETVFAGCGIAERPSTQCLHGYRTGIPEEKCARCSIEKKEDAGAGRRLRNNGESVAQCLADAAKSPSPLACSVLFVPQVRARDGRETGKRCNAAAANPPRQPQTEAGRWLLAAVNFDSLNRQVPRGHTSKVRRRSRCCASWLALVRAKYDRIFLQPSSLIFV